MQSKAQYKSIIDRARRLNNQIYLILDEKISKNYLKKKRGQISADDLEQKVHEALQELRSTLSKESVIQNLNDLEKEYDIHMEGQELIFARLDPENRKNLRRKYFQVFHVLKKCLGGSRMVLGAPRILFKRLISGKSLSVEK